MFLLKMLIDTLFFLYVTLADSNEYGDCERELSSFQ